MHCRQLSCPLVSLSVYNKRDCEGVYPFDKISAFQCQIIIIVMLLLVSFSYQCLLRVSHWSLNDSKSHQMFWTLLSILADLSIDVVWMVLARPPMSNSSSPLTKPFGTVLSAPITIGITITFMFHSFFFFVLWQCPNTCLSFHFLQFSFWVLSRLFVAIKKHRDISPFFFFLPFFLSADSFTFIL